MCIFILFYIFFFALFYCTIYPSRLYMLNNLFRSMINNKNTFLILLVVIAFIYLSFYIYNTYVKPRFEKRFVENKEFVLNEESNDQIYAEIILFYTDWCPHSKKAMEVWKQFKEKMNNVTIQKYTLVFKEVDCEEDSKTADEYDITGYPTIKLIKNADEIIEFDAQPTMETLEDFVNTILS